MDFAKFLYTNHLKARDIAKYLDIADASVSRYVSGKTKPSPENLDSLLNNPYGWDTSALTESGDSVNIKSSGNSRNTVTINDSRNSASQRDVQPVRENTIPLIPIDAHAGSLCDYAEGVMAYHCERIANPFSSATLAIRVTGDSMEPRYVSGDIVFAQKVNEKAFLEWGRTYLLDTTNGAVIKQIQPGSSDSHVKCVSLNTKYQAFEIPHEFIKGWYKVVGLLSFE